MIKFGKLKESASDMFGNLFGVLFVFKYIKSMGISGNYNFAIAI